MTGLAADRIAGTLLGLALGDALGLPAEGKSARSIARRFGPIGFVSDDAEQAGLVAQSLARNLALRPVILAHGFRRLVPFRTARGPITLGRRRASWSP